MKSSDTFTPVDYGMVFAKLFRLNIPRVPKHIAKRVKSGDTKGEPSRRRRDVDFIEDDLKRYLKNGYVAPIKGCPPLEFEQEVRFGGGKRKRIDYVFRYLSVHLTCEWKGPARPKLLKDRNNKWFRGVKEDVRRQSRPQSKGVAA